MEIRKVVAILPSVETANDFCTALRIDAEDREEVGEYAWRCPVRGNGTDQPYIVFAQQRSHLYSALAQIGEPHTRMYIRCVGRPYVHVTGDDSPCAFRVRDVDALCDLLPLTDEERERVQEAFFPVNAAQQDAFSPFERFFLERIAAQLPVEVAPTAQHSNIPKEWKKRLREDGVEPATGVTQEDDACTICADGNKRTVLFVPCDHLVCCDSCARQWMEVSATCPVCREAVEDVRRIKK